LAKEERTFKVKSLIHYVIVLVLFIYNTHNRKKLLCSMDDCNKNVKKAISDVNSTIKRLEKMVG